MGSIRIDKTILKRNFNWFNTKLIYTVRDSIKYLSIKAKIFISYSKDDGTPIAKDIAIYLNKLGYVVFFDKFSILPGEQWEAKIKNSVRDYDIMIPVITDGALRSEWVAKEVKEAIHYHKLIIPFMDRRITKHDLKWGLDEIQNLPFDQDISAEKRDLAEAIKENLQDPKFPLRDKYRRERILKKTKLSLLSSIAVIVILLVYYIFFCTSNCTL